MQPKERPILFSDPMVRAILDGSKTQTRRAMKPQPVRIGDTTVLEWRDGLFQPERLPTNSNMLKHYPYGQQGDRLWVREAWSVDALGAFGTPQGYDSTYALRYRADDSEREIHVAPGEPDPYIKLYDSQRGDWSPSIHMPRWACRILLEIVSVRMERLHDIGHDDAYAEGTQVWAAETVRDGNKYSSILTAWRGLWTAVNGADSWEANPFVWVVEFKRVTL